MRYRRQRVAGGTYFFTVVTAGRRPMLASSDSVGRLREAFRHVRTRHPFRIDAIAVLPDHLHAVWTLPGGDADYSTRWRLIKSRFTRGYVSTGAIWQNRFWEHVIRDERDLAAHIDYIHFNPVKHGLVQRAADWPHSSFHRYAASGVYGADWGSGGDPPALSDDIGRE